MRTVRARCDWCGLPQHRHGPSYYNEAGVGAAIAKCGIPRSELFITTKVWISNAGEERAAASIEESLRKLHTDYIDLLLIHQPFADYYGNVSGHGKGCTAGKVRAIGVATSTPTGSWTWPKRRD